MRFPTLDQQECRRPIILLHLRAASGAVVFLDVLVDTGSDVTLLPVDAAESLQCDLEGIEEIVVESLVGGECRYRPATIECELRRLPEVIRWNAKIGFVDREMRYGIVGTRGFLEFFRLTYDASECWLDLMPKEDRGVSATTTD